VLQDNRYELFLKSASADFFFPMKHKITNILLISAVFILGFQTHDWMSNHAKHEHSTGRVTGIGGIFFKCQDPKAVRTWYQEHLGIITNEYGAVFEWRQGADSSQKAFSQWSPFNEKTKYFAPSTKDFMINYRVENIENLIAQLKASGVVITDSLESFEYGKFIHILDIEGNKIELWEPNDHAFEQLGIQMGAPTNK
jgi:predicted enzyme related to lactoylglutathione lyase